MNFIDFKIHDATIKIEEKEYLLQTEQVDGSVKLNTPLVRRYDMIHSHKAKFTFTLSQYYVTGLASNIIFGNITIKSFETKTSHWDTTHTHTHTLIPFQFTLFTVFFFNNAFPCLTK